MSDLIKAMEEVNDLNRTHGVTQRGGKKYTEVFVRVEAFRKAFGIDLGINTEILVDDGKRVVTRAVVVNQSGMVVGSGMAEEIRGQGNVNKTSALENAETSAIGRALSSLGLHGGTYASINEIDAVERKSKAMAENHTADLPWQPMNYNNTPHKDPVAGPSEFKSVFADLVNGHQKQKGKTAAERKEILEALKKANGVHIKRLKGPDLHYVKEIYERSMELIERELNQ